MVVPAPSGTTAVVLTHRRPRLATRLVRALVDHEGLPPDRIVLVIDRDGGLDDPLLEQLVRVIRLERNLGPAAGFRTGMEEAFADASTTYAYLCEDDVLLTGLPVPRLAGLVAEVESHERHTGQRVGAVAAYGRRFIPSRGGTTAAYTPTDAGPRLQPIDVAAWGATLVSRRVYDTGVRPDDTWFFGYEDFDFFLQVAAHGLEVLVDREAALATRPSWESVASRDASLGEERPADEQEAWRAFYVARNFLELARRHGGPSWVAWHFALSLRRIQLAPDAAARRAILAGLAHGLARRSGRHARYTRSVGEWPEQ